MTTEKRTCDLCGETKEAVKGIWMTTRGKPVGRVCLACVAAKKRGDRATEEGRAAANAQSVKYQLKRRKTDAWYRLRQQLAGKTRRLLKQLAQGKGTDAACHKLFGASREECLKHFNAQLASRNWSWQDYLAGGIEADHIVPFGLAQDTNQLRTLALLSNVQLLTTGENAIKAIADRALIKQHEYLKQEL
jgi:hypothetical protein